MLTKVNSIDQTDPSKIISPRKIPDYQTIPMYKGAFRSFWIDPTTPWHMTNVGRSYIERSFVLKSMQTYLDPSHPLSQSLNALGRSSGSNLLAKVKLTTTSTISAQWIYENEFGIPPVYIPQYVISDNSILLGDLQNSKLQKYLWAGEITVLGFEYIKMAHDDAQDVDNRREFMGNVHLMFLTEVISINALKFRYKKKKKIAIWDLFDHMKRAVPNSGKVLSADDGGYISDARYFMKLREVAIALETWLTKDMANSWMYWMTSDQFGDVLSDWRNLKTEIQFRDYCKIKYHLKDPQSRYTLLQNRRDLGAATRFIDRLMLISYIGRLEVSNAARNRIENVYSHKKDKKNPTSHNWKYLENVLNNLANFLSDRNNIALFSKGEPLRNIFTGIYQTTEQYVPFRTEIAMLMDFLSKLCQQPFIEGHSWRSKEGRAQFDVYMNFRTEGIHSALVRKYVGVNAIFVPLHAHPFSWVSPIRNYNVEDYLDVQALYRINTSNAGTDHINSILHGIFHTLSIDYDSLNEKRFLIKLYIDPSNHHSYTIGDVDCWVKNIVGAESLGQGSLRGSLIPTRRSLRNFLLQFNGWPYQFSDANTIPSKKIYYDFLLRLWDAHCLHVEVLGYNLPHYIFKKDFDCAFLLTQGFSPIYVLGGGVMAHNYLRNCQIIGKMAPLFLHSNQQKKFIHFLHQKACSSGTDLQGLINNLRTNWVSYGWKKLHAKAICTVFGIDFTTGIVLSTMMQWWLNYKQSGSPSLAFKHNLFVP